MIQLILIACSMHSPHHCKEEKLTFYDPGLTAMACVMKGQRELAKWSRGHPGWEVKRYRCARVGIYARA